MPIVFGYGKQPVDEPRPADVEHRIQAGAGDGEERHRLGEAVDRGAPLLAQQQQDGGDQRAGVADADPPDEVDDVEAPADGDVDAPDADAPEEQVS